MQQNRSRTSRAWALSLVVFSAVVVAVLLGTSASANDASRAVTLAELFPALDRSELGPIEVPVTSRHGRTVRRRDVVEAMRRAGHDEGELAALGVTVPEKVRVSRAPNRVSGSNLLETAQPMLASALAPCTIDDAELANPNAAARVEAGNLEVDVRRPTRTGGVTGAVIARGNGTQRRWLVHMSVSCPEHTVKAGTPVRISVTVGSVRATVPGEVKQAGYIGDTVWVRNSVSHASLRARIVDDKTVELVL